MATRKKKPQPVDPKDLAHATDRDRPLDGYANNTTHCCWGVAGNTLIRLTPGAGEGAHHTAPRGHKRVMADDPANPRSISNAVCREGEKLEDPAGRTHWMWAWGQFLDHQLDLTGESEELVVIDVRPDDPYLPAPADKKQLGINFKRSAMAPGTGIRHDTPREHTNLLSAWIDGSSVYGNDVERLALLVDPADGGKLATSAGDLLPLNAAEAGNADPADFAAKTDFYLAGDVRANEHVVLTSLHTIFVRLHNVRVDQLRAEGETDPFKLFTRARAWVAAVMQFITYCEFVPELLGAGAETGEYAYHGYRNNLEPAISTEFSTAAYRLGHSMLPDSIPVAEDVEFSIDGRLELRHAFFKPELLQDHGTATFVSQLHGEAMRQVDPIIADDLRNFLFRFPDGVGGMDLGLLDLAALNIMRGRDHRIGRYNDVREGLGMSRRATFDEIAADAEIAARLAQAYSTPDDVDLWVGGLCEAPMPDAVVGETFHTILLDQFVRLRDGDRWHWRNDDYPTFGEAFDCKSCAGGCSCEAHPRTHDHPAQGDPVLTDEERKGVSDWTLAKVLVATGSVPGDLFGDDPSSFNVFNTCAEHKVDHAGHEKDDGTRGMPGYGNQ